MNIEFRVIKFQKDFDSKQWINEMEIHGISITVKARKTGHLGTGGWAPRFGGAPRFEGVICVGFEPILGPRAPF